MTVTVHDKSAPALTLPADQTLEATSSAGAVATHAASATDVVDRVVAVTCAPASGATLPIGSTTVTCTAADAAGNTATGSFTATDAYSAAPVLMLPEDQSPEATSAAGAVATFTLGTGVRRNPGPGRWLRYGGCRWPGRD